MKMKWHVERESEWSARAVKDLRGRMLPEEGWLAGYSAIIERYGLALPLPPRLAFASIGHHPASNRQWLGVSVRRRPSGTLGAHLEFALKREGVDLPVLAALFGSIDPGEVAAIIRSTPTGKYSRRIWFLYEWLTGGTLDLPDAPKVKAEPVVSDSRSSFQIEGERPGLDRVERWGRAIGEAGDVHLSIAELERLQRMVLGDTRFVKPGLREEGGFVGEHDRATRAPLPEHINARPEDLRELVEGLIGFQRRSRDLGVDPVVTAAVVAFGFIYIHPFEDGNSRIHRWLIHHVLARAGYNPDRLVFPVSAAILRQASDYQKVLRSYSAPLLESIEWEATEEGNVRVLNETARLYRYFDATAHAEFLFQRIAETVERDLPREVAYLEGFDRFAERVQRLLGDMPHSTVDLLHRFLTQGRGRLSKRAREEDFEMLTADEANAVEDLWLECHAEVGQ